MEGNSSPDLTHLTEEEQSAILQVLQRDLDLQLVDEGRVRSEVTADAVLSIFATCGRSVSSMSQLRSEQVGKCRVKAVVVVLQTQIRFFFF